MVSLSTVQIVLASFGAIIGVLAVLVIRKLYHQSGMAMVRLQLLPEKTVHDFQIFTVGNAIMFTGFLIYLVGVLLARPVLYDVARYIGMVYGVFVTVVFYRWWRRL